MLDKSSKTRLENNKRVINKIEKNNHESTRKIMQFSHNSFWVLSQSLLDVQLLWNFNPVKTMLLESFGKKFNIIQNIFFPKEIISLFNLNYWCFEDFYFNYLEFLL